MTQVLQSGQHPDADQLNAFVEHALPLHEQQQMLAHLAVCPGCRAVAYLAQPAVIEEADLPRTVAAREPWFSGWNLALPAGLAVAFLVILFVHLRNVSTAKPDAEEINTVHLEQPSSLPQTASPPSQVAARKPVPAPIQKPQNAAGLLPNSVAADSSSNEVPRRPETLPLHLNGTLAANGQAVAPAVNPGSTSNTVFGGLPGQAISPQPRVATPAASTPASPSSSGAAQTATLGNVDAVHRDLRSSSSQYNSATVTAQSDLNPAFQAAPAPPPQPEAPRTENDAASVSSAPAMFETQSTQSSQLAAGNVAPSLARPALKMKKQPSLPSHLPALSTISNARQELAIDSAGTLFRSEDAGVTWQSIPAQWTGFAVKLQLSPLQTIAKNANSAASTAAAMPTPTVPVQPAFELTNDAGDIWISADGQKWKRK